MKTLSTLFASALLLAAPASFAADASIGHFQPEVTTGDIVQSVSGTDNVNDLQIGTLDGHIGVSLGGHFQPMVTTGDVVQVNGGTKNKNRIRIGVID